MTKEMTRERAARQVVDMMSWLINHHARRLASEQRHPGAAPDESDDEIKEEKVRVKALRRLREEFEDCFTGATF